MKFKIFLLWLFIGNAIVIKAFGDENEFLPVNVPSPQAYSFFNFSDYQVGYATGIPEINIPIHTIKEGDLEVPITLSYHAGTVKPREQPGWVGLGWTLNTGGCITRSVTSLPDDRVNNGWFFSKYSSADCQIVNGEFMLIIDGSPDVFRYSFGDHTGEFYFNANNEIISLSPDGDKIEQIIDGDDFGPYDGLSSLKNYWTGMTLQPEVFFIGFRIITNKGVIYEFKQIEYSFPMGSAPGPFDQRIDTWYLTRIISPDTNDEITFTYQKTLHYFHVLTEKNNSVAIAYTNGTSEFASNHFYDITNINEVVYLKEIECTQSKQKIEFQISPRTDLSYPYRQAHGYQVHSTGNYKGHKLDRIDISKNGVLVKYYTLNYLGDYYKKLKLNKLQEYSADGLLSCPPYTFSYPLNTLGYIEYYDHWGYYNKSNMTDFSYFLDMKLIQDIDNRKPVYESRAIDEFPDLLTKITYPTGGYTQFTWESNTFSKVADDVDFEPKELISHQYYRDGLEFEEIKNYLKTETVQLHFTKYTDVYVCIVFCSSGTTMATCGGPGMVCKYRFQVSPNTYNLNQIINYVYDAAPNTILEGTPPTDGRAIYNAKVVYFEYSDRSLEYTGGARIKKIDTYDNETGLTTTRSYEYTLENGLSSGVIGTFPKYDLLGGIHYVRFDNCGGIVTSETVTANLKYNSSKTLSPISYTNGSHVNYSRVIVRNSNGSKSIYKFTTFTDYPDITSSNVPPAILTDYSSARGKTIQEDHYNSGESTPFSTRKYVYEEVNNLTESGHIFKIFGEYIISGVSLKIYIYVHGTFYTYEPFIHKRWVLRPAQTEETIDGVTTTISYNYDNTELINHVRKMTKTQGAETLTTTTRYVVDYDNINDGTMISSLKNLNMIALPVEKFSSGDIIDGNLFMYYTNSGLEGKLNKMYSLKSTEPYLSVTDSRYTFNNNLSNFDPRYQTTQDPEIELSYSKGRVVNEKSPGNKNTSYIWGYNYMVPIAKIENATITEVKSALSKSSADNLSYLQTYTDIQIRTEINKIRTNISSAGVTTYTYRPLIGINSITDDRGLTTYYDYDDLGRLKYIRDFEGNVLQRYEYNYAH